MPVDDLEAPPPSTPACEVACNCLLRKQHHTPEVPALNTLRPTLTHGQTMPHFGATTSSHLGKGPGTPHPLYKLRQCTELLRSLCPL